MANEEGKIHIDSDWKSEAAAEKERLAEQERSEQEKKAAQGGAPQPGEPSFLELVNLLAMQAAIALGGYQGPGGERFAPNPIAAKFQIDLLDILAEKTKGNLTEEEKKLLDAVTHELRMHYVSIATGSGAPGSSGKAPS